MVGAGERGLCTARPVQLHSLHSAAITSGGIKLSQNIHTDAEELDCWTKGRRIERWKEDDG